MTGSTLLKQEWPGTAPGVHTQRASAVASVRRLVLPDGLTIPYRAIRPDDASALQHFHDRLSETTIRLRFFGAMPHLSDAMARYFTHLDGTNRFALVALDPDAENEIIAVVRFDRDPGTASAEYAAVVADRWQGYGLGLALTRHLIEEARARGVRILTAEVLPENSRMHHLLHDLGLEEQVHYRCGIDHITVAISKDDGADGRCHEETPAGVVGVGTGTPR